MSEDLTRDGVADLVFGSPASGATPGEVFVVSGTTTGIVDAALVADSFSVGGFADTLGTAVATVDVNGDGIDDLVASGMGAYGLVFGCGAAYLVLGPIAGAMDVTHVDATFHGAVTCGYFGLSLAMLDNGEGVN